MLDVATVTVWATTKACARAEKVFHILQFPCMVKTIEVKSAVGPRIYRGINMQPNAIDLMQLIMITTRKIWEQLVRKTS